VGTMRVGIASQLIPRLELRFAQSRQREMWLATRVDRTLFAPFRARNPFEQTSFKHPSHQWTCLLVPPCLSRWSVIAQVQIEGRWRRPISEEVPCRIEKGEELMLGHSTIDMQIRIPDQTAYKTEFQKIRTQDPIADRKDALQGLGLKNGLSGPKNNREQELDMLSRRRAEVMRWLDKCFDLAAARDHFHPFFGLSSSGWSSRARTACA